MDKVTRIKKIQEVIDRDSANPFGKQEIPWMDKLESMPVYQIPLEYLVYNKYNWRILSRTKSLEKQKHSIDEASDEWKELIEKLLWDSHPERNKRTLENIEKYWQEKVWIITKDWIIIDWNRRVRILNEIQRRGKTKRIDYFKAVVLDVTLEENPLEIEKLETSFQMGEDEKVWYNPIEKYIKVKWLVERRVTIEKIAEWMRESASKIEEYIEIMKVMDEYLEYFGYNWIYTQLDEREDQFIYLNKWLNTFYNTSSKKGFDWYKDSDVDDLKFISFDYIRIRKNYDGKKFRSIADGARENHFFWDKKIWNDFKTVHYSKIDEIKDQEEPIDYNSSNISAHLDDRDSKFFELTKLWSKDSFIEENMENHVQQLGYERSKWEPLKLISNAKKSLGAIDQMNSAFADPRVLNQIEILNELTTNMLKEKSISKLLAHIVNLLRWVKIDDSTPSRDELLEKIKEINHLSFDIKKELWG